MIYILDTNFFIQAHRVNYPLDVVISFWNKFKDLSLGGDTLISIDKVQNELNHSTHPDQLATWCAQNLPDGFFKDSSIAINEYTKIVNWAVSHQTYNQNAKSEFLASGEADAFLVAYALTDPSNFTLITHEVSNPYIKNRIKIPEVCDKFNIKYCNTIEMFRRLEQTF